MNKKNIANIIYDELSYMYCDNCRYATELIEDPNTDIPPCDDCHRKSNNWGISMAEAERIATKIQHINKSNHCSNCGAKMESDE